MIGRKKSERVRPAYGNQRGRSHRPEAPGRSLHLVELPVEPLVTLAAIVELHEARSADLSCCMHMCAAARLCIEVPDFNGCGHG